MALKRVRRIGHVTNDANSFLGRDREITVDISTYELRVHDGITPGGNRVLNKGQLDTLYFAKDTAQFDISGGAFKFNAGQADLDFLIHSAANLNEFVMDGATGVITINGIGILTLAAAHNALDAATLKKAANLADITNAATARTQLGLGNMVTLNSPLPVANGGTGSTTAADARTALGLALPLAIASGGTGATSAANAFAALKQDATTTATGVLEIATDAEFLGQAANNKIVVPSNFAAKPAFKVTKGGSAQVINSATYTDLTFGTEVYDVGGAFASNAWTAPVAGKVRMSGRALASAGVVADSAAIGAITKNGAIIGFEVRHSSHTGDITCSIDLTDDTDAGDVYKFQARLDGAGAKTIDGGDTNTWFSGEYV